MMPDQTTETNAKINLRKFMPIFVVSMLIFIVTFFAMFWQILPRVLPDKKNIAENTPISSFSEKENLISAPSHYEESEQDRHRIKELELEIATLKDNHLSAMKRLKEQSAEENSENHRKAQQAVATMIAFSELKETIIAGKPYLDKLKKFRELIPNHVQINEQLNKLEIHSEDGIITPDKQKEEFARLAKESVIRANSGMLNNVIHTFIVIRKVGDVEGDDDEAVIARAEVKLTNNDINDVIKELEKLSPAAQENFKNWVNNSETWRSSIENINTLQFLLTQTEPASQL